MLREFVLPRAAFVLKSVVNEFGVLAHEHGAEDFPDEVVLGDIRTSLVDENNGAEGLESIITKIHSSNTTSSYVYLYSVGTSRHYRLKKNCGILLSS